MSKGLNRIERELIIDLIHLKTKKPEWSFGELFKKIIDEVTLEGLTIISNERLHEVITNLKKDLEDHFIYGH